jgi:hypothetical protein
MDRDIENQTKQLNQKLQNVFEKQERNQSAIWIVSFQSTA